LTSAERGRVLERAGWHDRHMAHGCGIEPDGTRTVTARRGDHVAMEAKVLR